MSYQTAEKESSLLVTSVCNYSHLPFEWAVLPSALPPIAFQVPFSDGVQIFPDCFLTYATIVHSNLPTSYRRHLMPRLSCLSFESRATMEYPAHPSWYGRVLRTVRHAYFTASFWPDLPVLVIIYTRPASLSAVHLFMHFQSVLPDSFRMLLQVAS